MAEALVNRVEIKKENWFFVNGMAQYAPCDGEENMMNTIPLTNIAPDIFKKRLLIEGYFHVEVKEAKSDLCQIPAV